MAIYTYSLARVPIRVALAALYRAPAKGAIPGLIHSEFMAKMQLGASIFSPARMQLKTLVMFAVWEREEAIDQFLHHTDLGSYFQAGWHVRMEFLRRWGFVRELDGLAESGGEANPDEPVVAVTLARIRLPEILRFIKWGKPVEELVRDHPGTTFALASMRLPRTVSTFSVWSSQREMVEMVHGHSQVRDPDRHADAMKERIRKDFHFEFTTLRFRPLAEYGKWEGRSQLVPFSERKNEGQ